MKKSIILIMLFSLIILGSCSLGVQDTNDDDNDDEVSYSEARVRFILADISLGGPISYYESYTDDDNCVEAVDRWNSGVRVTNIEDFEKKHVNNSWYIVYTGTETTIDGMDVVLSTD